ncbi:MAG: site-2 protease family protein, partial [Microbacteriaceae bacterium]
KKVIIMLGGPLMNLVLAIVFYAILVAGFGVPQATTTVGQVNECLVSANAQATECTSDMPEAPAAAAGLLPGDTVVAIDGEAMTEWDRVREIVAANPEQPLNFEIEREGKTQTLQLTPAVNERARADASGAKIVGPDGEVEVESVGMMGVVPTMELERQPVTAAPALVIDNIRAVGDVIIHMPQRLVDVWQAAFGSEERALNGPVSVVGVGRIAGDLVSNDATPVVDKAQAMVGLLASLNVALFVFNLIPLTPLDGGHIAGAVYEGAKRRLWKLFGKGDPGPVDTAKMVPVTLVVATLLLGMTLLLIYADIVKPMSLS